ncbi:MAG: metal ABC transporter substrate-binding protein [Actinobacteria bacterium]|nr:metal ABC transporter substrate-binding protein [Actinomycetota bacterium]
MIRVTAALVGASLLLVACGSVGGAPPRERLLVVTTVAPITDIVAQVAGDDVEVRGLVPEGVDSHTFEPSPDDARLLAEADAMIVNGLFLEEPSLELARPNLPEGAPIVALAERTIDRDEWIFDVSFPREEGRPNPHLWTDPRLARAYAGHVRDVLSELDPDHAEGYARRFELFADILDRLDAAIARAWSTVPTDHRKLVTYHDSWPYFARRYGIEVVAAVQPSDFSEPSAREVRDVIEQVRAAGVPAIFGSEVFPSPVLRRIAEESGARYVDDLADDDLPGAPGDPDHSYVGMMVANVRAMVSALGGDPAALGELDPTR